MQWLGRKKSFFPNLYRNTPKEGLTKFQIYVETKKLGLLIFIQAHCYGRPGGGKKTQKRLSIWILSKSNTRHSSIQGSQLPGWLIGNCIAFLRYYDIRTEASWTPGLSSLGFGWESLIFILVILVLESGCSKLLDTVRHLVLRTECPLGPPALAWAPGLSS